MLLEVVKKGLILDKGLKGGLTDGTNMVMRGVMMSSKVFGLNSYCMRVPFTGSKAMFVRAV